MQAPCAGACIRTVRSTTPSVYTYVERGKKNMTMYLSTRVSTDRSDPLNGDMPIVVTP
jgi:hypothetical protein